MRHNPGPRVERKDANNRGFVDLGVYGVLRGLGMKLGGLKACVSRLESFAVAIFSTKALRAYRVWLEGG